MPPESPVVALFYPINQLPGANFIDKTENVYQIKNHLRFLMCKWFILSDPAETRTLGPLIKSQLLYQLSYGVN